MRPLDPSTHRIGNSTAETSIAGDNVKLGVAVILAAGFALSLGDAAVKGISAGFVLWQIFVMRSVITVPLLIAAIMLKYPTISLMPRQLGWVAFRSLLLTFMWVSYYAYLPHLELGIAGATLYTTPIFITLLAAFFLGDRIRPLGWVAVAAGFVGVLLILKPDAEGFNLYALSPLLAAIFYASAMVLTRGKCREEHPLILSLSLNIAFVIIGLLATIVISLAGPIDQPESAFLFGEWSTMGGKEWLAMALMAGAILIGSIGSAIAYQVGPPAIIAIFDFAYVGFVAIWGIVFFGEVLDTMTVLGMLLIVAAGIMAVRR